MESWGVSAASGGWAMTLVAPILPIAWWSTGGFASDVQRPRVLELEARLQGMAVPTILEAQCAGIKKMFISLCKSRGNFFGFG